MGFFLLGKPGGGMSPESDQRVVLLLVWTEMEKEKESRWKGCWLLRKRKGEGKELVYHLHHQHHPGINSPHYMERVLSIPRCLPTYLSSYTVNNSTQSKI